MIQLGVLGASGKSGTKVVELAEGEFKDRVIVRSAVRRGGDFTVLLDCDVVIDFSTPEAASALFSLLATAPAARALPAVVSATTGWTLDQRKLHQAAGARTACLFSSNFSVGVMAYIHLLKQAGPLLERLGYRSSIQETHHTHKKDSPSGTALSMQRAMSPSGPGNVPIQSLRQGEVVGEHLAVFDAINGGDRLTFAHSALDRAIFARGALTAALWISQKRVGQEHGVFGMDAFFSSLL